MTRILAGLAALVLAVTGLTGCRVHGSTSGGYNDGGYSHHHTTHVYHHVVVHHYYHH